MCGSVLWCVVGMCAFTAVSMVVYHCVILASMLSSVSFGMLRVISSLKLSQLAFEKHGLEGIGI